MNRILTILLLSTTVISGELSPRLADEMADIIWKIEGGHAARKPFGVLSVKVLDAQHAREITIASIHANWRRWERAGRAGTFAQFMAHRWVPRSVDAAGHRRWVRNFNHHLRRANARAAATP
jgi:hypothetical protein